MKEVKGRTTMKEDTTGSWRIIGEWSLHNSKYDRTSLDLSHVSKKGCCFTVVRFRTKRSWSTWNPKWNKCPGCGMVMPGIIYAKMFEWAVEHYEQNNQNR